MLVVYSPIIVNASFISFCRGEPDCVASNYLGFAGPASLIPAKKEDDPQPLTYPSGLVKQMFFDGDLPSSVFGETDIICVFNSDYNFWFKVLFYMYFLCLLLIKVHLQASNTSIPQDQIDIEAMSLLMDLEFLTCKRQLQKVYFLYRLIVSILVLVHKPSLKPVIVNTYL